MDKPVFQRASKKQAKLRMALDGPAGSGKTFTGLIAATVLRNGGKIAVIDTEHGSASKYADMFEFDTLQLTNFHPQRYIDGIRAAEEAGYSVILIDSLSHAWEGEGGVLQLHEEATKRQKTENSYTAWRDVTPIHRDLVEAILQSKCHVIATMRSKMDYVQVKGEDGRTTIKKVGMAPVQRQGMEYEFDVVGDLDIDHNMVISKTRCFAIADAVVSKPTAAWFEPIVKWLGEGEAAPKPTPAPAPSGNGHDKPQPAPAKPTTVREIGIGILSSATARAGKKTEDGSLWSKVIATEPQRQAVTMTLDQALGEMPAKEKDTTRHAIYRMLFSVDSSSELNMAEAGAVLDWLCLPRKSKSDPIALKPESTAEVALMAAAAIAAAEAAVATPDGGGGE